MPPRGKQMFHTFKEAANAGPFDEYPMLPPGVDPQLHLSRNDRPQPFHLICGKDCVLVQMSGRAKVHFAEGPVRYHSVQPGDFVYVPAGMPHRVLPEDEGVQYRYKAAEAGLEGAAWYCGTCEAELHRHVWDTAETVIQRGYIEACAAFNASDDARTCGSCGATHDKVAFDTARWQSIADEFAGA
ncbi:MAG TPA: AraC family ligand binding domain-containing protein [Alphaproteobacteria bacterium]|nr:AraC family ligand binding domain-containing protein [Alphaproteobacteria bacterium]